MFAYFNGVRDFCEKMNRFTQANRPNPMLVVCI